MNNGRESFESDTLRLTAAAEDAGSRLDAFIGWNTDELSRSYAVRLIENGRVAVNGQAVTSKKSMVRDGDAIVIDLPEPETLDVKPENIPLDIVYEDEDVLVVNKPRGMVVHPGPGNWSGTLVNAVMYHCGDTLSSINGVVRPGIVHRIDKDTSGLLMIAKNDMSHESLAEQLRVHSVTRVYTALCYDNITQSEITIDVPIGRDDRNRMRRAVYGSAARDAVTHITVAERFGRYTLVRAKLETGRTHQIRVHMAYIGHPVAGDPVYGGKKYITKLNGQCLHAYYISFVHPRTNQTLSFSAPLPDYFKEFLKSISYLDNFCSKDIFSFLNDSTDSVNISMVDSYSLHISSLSFFESSNSSFNLV